MMPAEQNPEGDALKATNGDAEAFGRLVDCHFASIGKQMRHFSRDAAVCDELIQDVFVEAFLSLGTFRAEAPFAHWLSRIAIRVGYRYWKLRKNEPIKVQLQDWDAIARNGVDTLEHSEAADLLFDLLSRLKDRDRLILTLIYFENLDYAEVAERMGWSQAMTRLKTHRARNRLRDLAKREGLLEALS